METRSNGRRVTNIVALSSVEREQAKLNVLCLPSAGGNPSQYLKWARFIRSDIALYAYQPPGRGTRMAEPPFRVLADMADDVVDNVRECAGENWIIVGHSFGAILGYEVLLTLLESMPSMVSGFIASGSYAPQDVPLRPSFMHASKSDRELVETLRGSALDMPDDEGVAAMLSLVVPSIRSELDMLDSYRPEKLKRIGLKAAIVTSQDDPFIPRDAGSRWKETFPGARLVQPFHGGHNYLETHAEHMVRCLHELIDNPPMGDSCLDAEALADLTC